MANSSKTHGWDLSDEGDSEEDVSLLQTTSQSSRNGGKFASPSRIKKKEVPKRKTVEDCPSGARCYRKNPEHLRQFRHPEKTRTSESEEDFFEMPRKRKKLREESSPIAIWEKSSPLNYLLTTVSGIPDKFNYKGEGTSACSLHIRDILSFDFGDLVETAQFNYCIDVDWFLEQLPSEKRQIPILFIHGDSGADYSAIDRSKFSNIKTCKVALPPFGTHHTKMMFLRYKAGIRIVIHTANLVKRDWHQKTQGIWISPLFPLLPSQKQEERKPFSFKYDLLDYLSNYKSHPELLKWISHIKSHDLSSAKVIIIGSVPGRHKDSSLHKWGHMRLSRVLSSFVDPSSVSRWPVIGQFSSVGSLGADKDKWLCKELLKSLSSVKTKKLGNLMMSHGNVPLKLIFPTVENIRKSLEGYPAGASVPYSFSVAKKQIWFNNFLHQWKADHVGRSQASPHIKTYTRVSRDYSKAAWFLSTSSNMSKAAWGTLEKKETQLAIKSYELGVLFVPQRFFPDCGKDAFILGSDDTSEIDLVLPFSTPLLPYTEHDEPWIWDIPHKHLPDRNGNMWVPS